MQRFDICVLEDAIGYTFKNKSFLQEALTHSSYSNELKSKKQVCRCNERLEFLGDAVLSAVVSEYLFEKFPDTPEGELSTMRAALVQSQALASYSRSLGVGDFLYLGNGEEKNNGRNRQSTLENVFEGMENGKIVLKANGKEIPLSCSYTQRQIDILKAGGLLAYTKGE